MVARIPGAVALAALFFVATAVTFARGYPSKPLRMVIPFPPGAATDITGRYVACKLGEAVGQQAIADNRPGANGTARVD